MQPGSVFFLRFCGHFIFFHFFHLPAECVDCIHVAEAIVYLVRFGLNLLLLEGPVVEQYFYLLKNTVVGPVNIHQDIVRAANILFGLHTENAGVLFQAFIVLAKFLPALVEHHIDLFALQLVGEGIGAYGGLGKYQSMAKTC